MSLHQPWASLIQLGVKTIETRSWSTKYRGPLAIHAAQRRPDTEMLEDGMGGELWDGENCLAQWSQAEARDYSPNLAPPSHARWGLYLSPKWLWERMPLGAVVATCKLADCLPMVDPRPPNEPADLAPALWIVPGVPLRRVDCRLNPHGYHPITITNVEDQRPYGDFALGRWAWFLENVKALPEPAPARGHQGLWEWVA